MYEKPLSIHTSFTFGFFALMMTILSYVSSTVNKCDFVSSENRNNSTDTSKARCANEENVSAVSTSNNTPPDGRDQSFFIMLVYYFAPFRNVFYFTA